MDTNDLWKRLTISIYPSRFVQLFALYKHLNFLSVDLVLVYFVVNVLCFSMFQYSRKNFIIVLSVVYICIIAGARNGSRMVWR